MKKRLITLTLAAALLLTSGCNGEAGTPSNTTNGSNSDTVTTGGSDAANTDSAENNGDSTEAGSGDVTEANNGGDSQDLPSKDLTEEQQREYMIEHSFMTEGDTSRMARVLKKAQY